MKRVLVELASNRFFDIVAVGSEFPVVDGYVWVNAPDGVTNQWKYDGVSFTAPPPMNFKVPLQETANIVIEKQLPMWKQINNITRAMILLERKFDGVITQNELIELDAIKANWTWIDAIRTKSNQAELSNTAPDDVKWS